MQLGNDDFIRLRDFMHNNYGINLEKKASLIEGRLANVIARKGFRSFGEYIDFVVTDTSGDEVALLVSKLTTNYTYFMREEQHYKFLVGTALPEWVKRIKDNDLRIWSAGCSSGEEAYTTAIVISEFMGIKKTGWDTTILATDISENILQIARKGLYTEDKLNNMPQTYKAKYFTKVDSDTYRLTDALKKEVVFSNFNLMNKTMPFRRKFHIIFCRNVMIYFDNKTREELANRFYNALEPGGYLFIGLSETIANMKTPFEYVSPSIYRRGLNK